MFLEVQIYRKQISNKMVFRKSNNAYVSFRIIRDIRVLKSFRKLLTSKSPCEHYLNKISDCFRETLSSKYIFKYHTFAIKYYLSVCILVAFSIQLLRRLTKHVESQLYIIFLIFPETKLLNMIFQGALFCMKLFKMCIIHKLFFSFCLTN